jgi:acyl-coenzyme A thioesterase 9
MWPDSVAYADSKNPAKKPSNMIFMSKATLHSAQIMQPQYGNRHNFMIFGGTFFYTFQVDTEVSVLPQSYSEFMRWVGGRRRAQRLSKSLEDDAKERRVSVIGRSGAERLTE